MADIYINVGYDEYKRFEEQCKAFIETTHGEGTEWYHKAMRFNLGDITFEVHGPNVKARVTIDPSDENPAEPATLAEVIWPKSELGRGPFNRKGSEPID